MTLKIAVVGAGFAGLAAAIAALDRGMEVELFEATGVGAGASGVASGLLHPYPGEAGRRSLRADEALADARQLIGRAEAALGKKIADHGGILRCVPKEAMAEMLARGDGYGDLTQVGEQQIMIHSGSTIFSSLYLEGLKQLFLQLGGKLTLQKIDSLDDLPQVDGVVLAVGAGIRQLVKIEELKVLPKFLKGQTLLVEGISPSCSMIGKGYIAPTEEPGHYVVGSTYEREFVSEAPDPEFAKRDLLTKLSSWYPSTADLRVVSVRAAMRVCLSGHYMPRLERLEVGENPTWAMLGLGSRGLLYHALLGRELVTRMMQEVCWVRSAC